MKTQFLEKKFSQLAGQIMAEAETFTFNLKDLPVVNDFETNIRKEPKFDLIFEALDRKTNSCLYWFEVETSECGKILQDRLNTNRLSLTENLRIVPVKNNNTETKVLYVGIRRGGKRKRDNLSNISGRIIIHLGYYKVGSTQGLQLVHWTNEIDCKIHLKIVEFENLPNDYLNTVEKIIAYKLKPMCGIH